MIDGTSHLVLTPGVYHIIGTCTGRFSDGRQLTIKSGRWTFAETVTLEPMNPREQQLVEALEASKKYLEERAPEKIGGNLMEFVEASLLRKKIGDALDAVRTGPQFYESKFHAKWSQNWRIKVERLKEQISDLQVRLDEASTNLSNEVSSNDELRAQVELLTAERDEARHLHTHACHIVEDLRRNDRIPASEYQALKTEAARLEAMNRHLMERRDHWHAKTQELLGKIKTLAISVQQ